MLKQLSIFAENKKGTMQQITQILFENDVNILGSVNNDSAEYGIVRMVVSDPDKAEQALQAAGYMTRQTDVLGVEVVDQPGNLNSLLKTLLETNIDIDYIYLSFNRESGCPIMVFHVPVTLFRPSSSSIFSMEASGRGVILSIMVHGKLTFSGFCR